MTRSKTTKKPQALQLSSRQRRALLALRAVRKMLEAWAGPALDIPEGLVRAYSGAMHRACRVGLGTHPEVESWVKAQRALGGRDSLRRARLERGVKKPMSPEEAKLFEAIAYCLDREMLRRASPEELAEIREHMSPSEWQVFDGIVCSHDDELSSWASIQRVLSRLGVIGDLSKEEFNRRVEAIGLKDPEPSRRRMKFQSPFQVDPASPTFRLIRRLRRS